MNVKKIMALGLASVSVLALGACGNKGETKKKEEASGEKVTLKYLNWNFGTKGDKNLERMMIDNFNKSQDKIKVEIDETAEGENYVDKLNTEASAGKMPDIFMINDIPSSIKNDWLLDISDMANGDADFKSIPAGSVDTTKVDGKVVAVPFARHIFGYFVNNDLLDKLNQDPITNDSTVPEFVDAVKKATDINNKYIGTNRADAMIEWLPGELNKDLGWFTYTDGQFHLDSKEMIETMDTVKDLATNGYSFDNLTDDQKAKFTDPDSGKSFKAGEIAYFYNGTYFADEVKKDANFNFSFVGLPGGRQGVSHDYLGIAKSTKHPKEAFEFAKYMSFGKKGMLERIKLADKEGLALNTLPITDDKDVAEKYWDLQDIPGIKEASERTENAMFEPIKTIPGYIQARFEGKTGLKVGDEENANVWFIMNASGSGKINYQDYAAQIQKLAQKLYEDAAAEVKK